MCKNDECIQYLFLTNLVHKNDLLSLLQISHHTMPKQDLSQTMSIFL